MSHAMYVTWRTVDSAAIVWLMCTNQDPDPFMALPVPGKGMMSLTGYCGNPVICTGAVEALLTAKSILA